jgi:autotransporter-associated beta strand protein
MTVQSGVTPYVLLSVPIVLSASQTWNSSPGGYISATGIISETGDSKSLTTNGDVGLYGNNTFSGGVTVASGSLYVASNGAGSGTLTLSDGTNLEGNYSGLVALPNAVQLGNSVAVGSSYGNSLMLSGTVTAENASTTLNVLGDSTVVLSGMFTGPPSTELTITGNGPQLPWDGGSLLVMQGALGSQVSGIDVEGAALILAPTGSAISSYTSLPASGLNVGSTLSQWAYLGLDGAFASSGAVSGFLARYGSTLGHTINGTLGFDTFANPSIPNQFSDPIDLSQFNSPSFLGLGSATAAILSPTAMITPTPAGYLFGGGGGTLTVESSLSGSVGLTMSVAAAPLTLILQGSNIYTGGTTSNGGVLIFNSPPPSGAGSISLYGGYVGYTENAGLTATNFVGLIGTGATNGVIGFDSSDPVNHPQTLADAIDLSVFHGDNTPFIGTATVMTLTGAITPANGTYQFTGVKGGQVTVNSWLTGSNSVVVGLPSPIEANGSVSAVTLGDISNNYSGGTTLNSGILYVTNPSSLGTGALTVQNSYNSVLAPSGNAVTLGNNIILNSLLTLGQYGNANLLTLSGVISGLNGLYIYGNVALNGPNTFSGGTYILNDLNVAIGNPTALGTGPVYLWYSTLTENIPNPTVTDLLEGYGSTISLAPGATLTLNTDAQQSMYQYSGSIAGDTSNQVVIAGTGVEYLDGTSTYGGGTTVNSGRLIAGAPMALGAGPVIVDTGASLGVATGVTLTNPITLNPGSALGGSGTFSPPAGLTIAAMTKISPGADGVIAPFVGSLSFGTPLTFGAGGVYVFDVQNASGVAGTDYDTVNVTGAFTISATPSSRFMIAVRSIDPGSGLGGLSNFNSSQPYSWTLVSAGSISGFNSLDFSVNTSGFQNSLNGGSFFFSENGSALDLNFTPVPEPSTLILMLAGMAAIGARIRRSKRP